MINGSLQEEATNSQTCISDMIAPNKTTLQERSFKRSSLKGSMVSAGQEELNLVPKKHRLLQGWFDIRNTLSKSLYKGKQSQRFLEKMDKAKTCPFSILKVRFWSSPKCRKARM